MPKAAPTTTPRPAAAPDTAAIALAAEIDELGALEKEFAPLRAKLARIEQLRTAIRARFDARPAAELKTVDGARFVLQLGARGNVSTIDVPKAAKLMGAKLFTAAASLTLKSLEAHAAPGIVAAVVSVAPTGPRSIKTFEKGAGA